VERSSEFKLRLEAAETAAKGRVDSISRDTAKKLFFPGNVTLSATRVSDYYKCPYFYFCKHGLKLYAPKAVEINPLFTGTIVHSCLERVMSNEKDGKRVYNPEFTKLTDGELAKLIDRQTEEYIQSEMGGEFAKNQSFRCAVERLKKSTLGIAANFRDEMKKSLFIPVAFEYDLTDENGEPVFCVELDDSTTIAVVGKVDRADVYLDGDKAWLRIVDYKTGKQKFKEAEVYHGLDLQMLIYMLALSSEKSTLVGDNPHHAGITYSHLRFVKPSLNSEEVQAFEEKGELDGKLKIERAKAYKPDGMALGEEIFPALNKDYEGVYTVFRFTSKGTLHGSSAVKPVSEEYFKAMEQFALLKLKDMAEKLADGKIASDPIVTVVDNEDKIHCTNCDYRAMCSNPLPKNPRRVNYQTDGGLLSEELEKIMKKEENGNGGRVD
jgi:ATP-dependent helicase/nuclease subunit B